VRNPQAESAASEPPAEESAEDESLGEDSLF